MGVVESVIIRLTSLTIGQPCAVEVVEADDLSTLHVETTLDLEVASRALASAGIGSVRGDHVYGDPDTIAKIAHRQGDVTWQGKFENAVEHARRQGWTDPNGNVRMHIVQVRP